MSALIVRKLSKNQRANLIYQVTTLVRSTARCLLKNRMKSTPLLKAMPESPTAYTPVRRARTDDLF
jgi:hypothetical protein